ncbi:hypothetical protein [Nannocystis radixulma]|uniref:Lipoprotein n=1 Tax=Nannocystis radixulma TaxID=2995305 RepID=A0ABT5B760_9BACT|nr:hypothetical protein [Nannocystis radixulma]MDC0669490.1 hypothetical protein [Nannocystis radixulma]
MQRSLVLLTLLSLAACDGDKPAAAPAPAAPATKTAEPVKPEPAKPATDPAAVSTNDRSKDPAFALKKDGNNYVGLVLDRCPDGTRIADSLRDGEPQLADGKMTLKLTYGGCPRWTGFAVVPGEGSPLPFHLCEDIAHDTCEMAGHATWVFDIGDALKKNNATAVTYVVPRH